ncbi:MAG: S8 family peptidase [Chitinophagales bacterium]|nr:S8 family peptidase [Chitinophagales bacterium]
MVINKNKRLLAVLLLIFLFVFCTTAQTNKYEIGITTGVFIPNTTEKEDAIINKKLEKSFQSKYFKLLQFYNIPSTTQKKEWELQGLKLTDYLPGNAYFAIIDENFNLQQIENQIRAIIPIDSRFKLEQSIFSKGIPKHAIQNGKAQLILNYYVGLNFNDILQTLKEKNIEVLLFDTLTTQINISILPNRLNELVALPFIQYIDAVSPEPILEGLDFRNASGRSNYLNTGYNGLNYNGEGVVIAIGEGGALDTEIDAKGRVTLELGSGYSDHKVGVMENLGGAGNWDPTNRNQSWGATILSTTGSTNYAALYSSHNLLYTNHSYGYGVSGGYNSQARNHDILLSSIPQCAVFYSAGNDGTATGYAPYDIANWGNITGAAKMSKNMLAIGSLLSSDIQPAFSSKGPMYDGRIAPQVVIEGGGGTSFAAPKAAGIFAMLTQAYKSQNGGIEPASSLLRAIVFNTADDIDNLGPDFKTGYGRINVRRAYSVMTNYQFLNASVANSNTNSHTISVPNNTKQLRVMIVWPDVPAALNANPAIVNDLNLVVKDPSSTAYNPWVLDVSLPSSDTKLNTPAVRGVDNLNTIEQVTVDNPVAGNWTIEVNGFNVPSGPQTYFLSYEFLHDELQFMFPLKNERLVSNETYQLKWDSYGNDDPFSIEYQLNGGSWTTAALNIDSLTRSYAWVAPTVSGIQTIKFRIKRGSLISESDINYIGKSVDNFRITKVCNDTVTFRWSAVNGATAYKIYKLGARYMEEVTSNISYYGTSAILTGQSTVNNEYYAISAITGTYEGRRTYAIVKTPGDLNCVGINWTGTVSTDWFDPSNWATSTVPTSTDNVIIPAAPSNQPFIDNIGAVCGNITIDTGASLSMSNTNKYALSVYGDWINNGTFNAGIDTVDFASTSNYQEISGNATSNFYVLKVSKNNVNNILEATALITLNATTNPLIIESGTFKLSSTSTIFPFTNNGGADLVADEGVWNNGGTINVNLGSDNWYNAGRITLTAGTINVGTNSNNSIIQWNGGVLTIEDGTLKIAGCLRPYSDISSSTYKQYGGTVIVNAVGSTSTSRAPFEINPNVPFTMTGGTIIIRKASSNASDYWNKSDNATISGGTLQIGDASTPINQNIKINTINPIYNLVVNTTNNPTARLVSNNLNVINNIDINGGTLNANNLDIAIQGNWKNNSNFTAGTGSVTFNGYVNQNIIGNNTTVFNNLIINNKNGIDLSGTVNANINTVLTLLKGVINTSNNRVVMNTGSTVNRTLGHIFGKLQKTISTGSNVSANFEVGDATETHYTPASVLFNTVSNAGTITASTIASNHSAIDSSVLDATRSVNRNWTLSNNGIVFDNYNASFNFLSSDIDTSVDWNFLECAKYDAGTWTYPSIGTKTANSVEITNVSSFSDFQLGEHIAVLPIELLAFNVVLVDNHQVEIDWSTATEINNDYFIVEESTDAQHWTSLTTVNGQGNSSEISSYTTFDSQLTNGYNYYRLKQVDVDGSFTYSDIQYVVVENNNSIIAVYPNPTNDIVYIAGLNNQKIQIFSSLGQEVTSSVNINYNNNNCQADLSWLTDGIYFIKTPTEMLKVIKRSF